MTHEWTPVINWREPEAERAAARHIDMQLTLLQSHIGEFTSSVALLSHSRAMMQEFLKPIESHSGEALEQATQNGTKAQMVAKWSTIAAHHAALTVYHFRSIMHSVRHLLGQCPTLKAKVKTDLIDASIDDLEKTFPFWREIRDSIAHYADRSFSPDKVAKQTPKNGIFFNGLLAGDQLIFTNETGHMTLGVNMDSVAKLNAIKLQFYEAFREASREASR